MSAFNEIFNTIIIKQGEQGDQGEYNQVNEITLQNIPLSQNSDEEAQEEEPENADQDDYLLRLQEQEEEEDRYQAQLREQQEQACEEDYYEAYRDNDDYYDQWDEPYSREYPITRRELSRVPADMRAAFDPEYQEGLANFRAAAMESTFRKG